MAFSQIEPFGGAIDDLRAGLGPAMTCNVNRGNDTPMITPMQFFPWHEAMAEPEPQPETPEELARQIRERIFRIRE